MNFLTAKSKSRLRAFCLSGLFGLSILAIITGCDSFPPTGLITREAPHDLMSRLEHEASLTQDRTTAETETEKVNIEQWLTELEYVLVHPQGETLLDDRLQFHTLIRKNKITQYPCSTCHIEPLEALQTTTQENTSSTQQAHWDTKLNHAAESVMNCLTCHTADDMDNLHTLTGEAVDFDHSYQLCAQCHDQQYDDWEGGAHGKQIGGWAPPRVINNCVDCHNPHQPDWDTRWPAVTNAGKEE